ncbi:MAG: hydantoinase/oxoprolinase family protein [Gammaproteobacteria bacterium]|nr:hydantoinase/oxoprolinase family protein [Gammaproteobacteria bacterium]
MRRYYLGVDTGGTFTDFVALNARTGEIATFKVPSVPEDPARAVRAGIERLRDRHGIDPSRIGRFIFGTTVATNAVLEHKGARTALVATRGTRDVIEIQRLWRSHLFDLYIRKPPPLVPRRWRFEADERIGAHGEVVTPLTGEEAARVANLIAEGGFESVAVCGLFSFLNPAHERRLRDAVAAAAPDVPVSISCEVSPEFREYERATTTVMNAYVMPRIDRLASRLEAVAGETGCAGQVRIMQSNGGLMSAATTRRHPVRTLLSGPAGGVVGAVGVATAAGFDDIIAMDMGGTSLDISLVRGGEIALSTEGRVGDYPVQVPQVDVHTIGAGGGSIARVIRGALKVGPESAGADPGPVCYGKGGTQPTSTDAAVTLGYIDPRHFASGAMRLEVDAARRAIEGHVGEPLGMAAEEAALAIVRVQVAEMVIGIRAVSVERGWDPRDFTLLPFGGAGSLYAGLVAEDLGIERIFVPIEPGVLSAFGMLLTDVKYTDVVTRLMDTDTASAADFEEIYQGLERNLHRELSGEGIDAGAARFERSCDMRYRGQAYEVNVPVPEAAEDGLVAAMTDAFHARHRGLYGQAAEGDPVEFVNYRVTGIGVIRKPELKPREGGIRQVAPKGVRRACFPRVGWIETPVFERADLAPGAELSGPALVGEPGATVVLFPGHRLAVDRLGNMAVRVGTCDGQEAGT